MPRIPRTEALSSLYHITARGCGRQRLFENDSDRTFLTKQLSDNAHKEQVQIKAWCLMDNHFHILVSGDLRCISHMMQRTNTTYALYFNSLYKHVGHVFQGRFHSTPVETEEQLLATIRYIHLNPVVDGIASLESFKWSSYHQHLGGRGICELSDLRGLFASSKEFRRFHDVAINELPVDPAETHRYRLSDDEASRIASSHFGKRFADKIAALPTERRDEALKTLYELGISERQLERLTGIGRNIIHRARSK